MVFSQKYHVDSDTRERDSVCAFTAIGYLYCQKDNLV